MAVDDDYLQYNKLLDTTKKYEFHVSKISANPDLIIDGSNLDLSFNNVNIKNKLTIDGSNVLIIPSLTSNSGKYLTTDGNNLSWGTVSSGGGGSDISLLNYSDASFGNVDISGTLNSMLVFDFANKRINPASPDNNAVINLGYKNSSSDRARFNEVHLKKLFTTQINNHWRYRLYSDPTYSSDPFIIYSDQNGS